MYEEMKKPENRSGINNLVTQMNSIEKLKSQHKYNKHVLPGVFEVAQFKKNIAGREFSNNFLFAKDIDGAALYAEPGNAPAPIDFFNKTDVKKIKITSRQEWDKNGRRLPMTKPYDVYKPKAEFDQNRNKWGDFIGPNDCLQYAAALAKNSKIWGSVKAGDGKGERTNLKQISDGKDNQWSNSPHDGNDPEVDVGDTYYMRPKNKNLKVPGRCNHHGSTVIAKDGADKITSEADASTGRAKPVFEMYGSRGDGSFYELYENYYTDTGDNKPVLTGLTKK